MAATGFSVVVAIIGLLPTLLAGVALIVFGCRGRARWSLPKCAKCQYELAGLDPEATKNCPECGADLQAKRAVHFLDYGRRWGVISSGIVVLVSPFLFGMAVFLLNLVMSSTVTGVAVGIHPGNMSSQSTQAILTQYLPQHIDEPWAWNELEARLKTGQLTGAEVQQAVSLLVNHMKSTHPAGWGQPLSWQGGCLDQMVQRGLMPDAQKIALAEAFYGPLRIQAPQRAKAGGRSQFTVHFGSTWDDHGGVPLLQVAHATGVRVAGKPVEWKPRHRWGREIVLYYQPDALPSGTHEVQIDVEVGLIARANMVGMNRHELERSDWPTLLDLKTVTLTHQLRVLADTEIPAKLVTPPGQGPMLGVNISLQDVVVQKNKSQRRLVFVFDETVAADCPFAFRLEADVKGKRYPIKGRRMAFKKGNGSTSSGTDEHILDLDAGVLSPDVSHIDLHLIPAPEVLNRYPDVDTCWGEALVFRDIELRRLDLAG